MSDRSRSCRAFAGFDEEDHVDEARVTFLTSSARPPLNYPTCLSARRCCGMPPVPICRTNLGRGHDHPICSITNDALFDLVPPAMGVMVSAVEFPDGFLTVSAEFMTVVLINTSPVI